MWSSQQKIPEGMFTVKTHASPTGELGSCRQKCPPAGNWTQGGTCYRGASLSHEEDNTGGPRG